MIPTERDRALHELLDGSATPREAAETEAWLATSAEGRQRRAELEALFARLRDAPRATPPPQLREGVMSAIRRGVAPAHRAPARPRWLLLVPAGVVAALLAILAPQAWRGSRRALPEEVSGSIAGNAAFARAEIRVPGARVHVRVRRTGAEERVELEADGRAPVEIELTGPADRLASARVRAGAATVSHPGPGRLVLALPGAGSATLSLPLAAAGAVGVRVELRSGGRSAGTALPVPSADR